MSIVIDLQVAADTLAACKTLVETGKELAHTVEAIMSACNAILDAVESEAVRDTFDAIKIFVAAHNVLAACSVIMAASLAHSAYSVYRNRGVFGLLLLIQSLSIKFYYKHTYPSLNIYYPLLGISSAQRR